MLARQLVPALLFHAVLVAQPPSIITSVGYSSPQPISVAPGQIVTLFIRTTQIGLDHPVTAEAGASLPESLAGLSVGLKQTFAVQEQRVPLLSAAPVTQCAAVTPIACSNLTALTVQIPYELQWNAPDPRLPANFAALTVYENGIAGDPLRLNPIPAKLHIVTTCDSTDVNVNPPCVPLILHADSTPVTLQNAATPGEILTAHLYGAGRADSWVATGAKPTAAINVAGISVYAAFGNDLRPGASDTTIDISDSVISPNAVGLTIIRFSAPALPTDTPSCSARGVTDAFNVTLTFARGDSADSSGICVRN